MSQGEASRKGKDTMGEAVLDGVHVVDLVGSVASSYCGKLFANLGALVVNLEPESRGHQARRLPPLFADGAELANSALFDGLSANKKSVTYAGPVERSTAARRLLARADVVLSAPDAVDREWLRDAAPQAVAVSLSWFGDSGPSSRHLGTDGVVAALIGMVRGIGPAEGPPLLPAGVPCQVIAGTTAFMATLAQLIGRLASGSSSFTRIESSVLEASLCITEPGPVGALMTDEARPRLGVNRFWPTYPASIYPCRAGHLGITALTPSQWRTFCGMLGLDELADDPRYLVTLQRLADADHLEALILPALQARTAEEWFLEGQERRVPLALVPTIEELLATPQFVERAAFCEVESSSGTLKVPALPFRMQRTPAVCGGRAPGLGEHDELDVLKPLHAHPAAVAEAGQRLDVQRPLAGLRIVDLGMGWAGPLATRQLADLGAEVLKVESCQYFDWWRGWEVTPEMLAERLYEKATAFLTVNRNKKAITLDLTRREGRDLLGRLIARSDALLENYAGSVLPKLGLGDDQLRRWRPDLVIVHMPPFGASGAWRDFRAYGSTVEQASGLPHLQGESHWPPTMQHVALGDPIAGITGATALLAALYHKQRTGEGQTVDISHVESLFPLGLHGFAELAVTGEAPVRRGSRHPRHAPHGVFPCRDTRDSTDRWVAITVQSAYHWTSLRAFLEAQHDLPDTLRAALAGPFATRAGRKEHEDGLEELLGAFTRGRDDLELAEALQQAGVPAAPVRGALEVLHDRHLAERRFWQWREREHVGSIPHPSAPFRFGGGASDGTEPLPIRSPSPTLGEHNAEVLRGLLGLSPEQLEQLERDRIIGSEPVAR